MKKLYNRYFPTPKYLAMNSCALDISDRSIKYGELIATSLGLRLGRYGKESIPSGIVVSGKINNESKLVEILRDLAKRKNLHFIRASLPEEQMYLFTLTIPKSDVSNIRDVISLQLEEHIPLSALDTTFDYNIISETHQGMFVEVLAVATSVVESYLSIFKKAGLTPISFELEAQAIARSVMPLEDKESVMIVDFGESRTGISIADSGRVLFTTTIDFGGNVLTNMIAKNFNTSYEEAEKMKLSYSLDSQSNAKEIFPIILNGISVLRDELMKQYTYWKTHTEEVAAHKDISRVILCGGDANLAGLANYLEASMKIKIENSNAWVNISDMKISVPNMSFYESFGYTTVLGLALADYAENPKSLINVLPQNEKKALKRNYIMRLSIMSMHLISLLSIIAILLSLPSYFFTISKLTFAETRLESFNKENPDLNTHDLNSTIIDINKKLVLLNSKADSFVLSDFLLGDIIDKRPQGVLIDSVSFVGNTNNPRKIQIHGISADRTALRNYKTILSENTNIASVEVPLSDFIEKTNIKFSISIILK